jgi:hypothetical protein
VKENIIYIIILAGILFGLPAVVLLSSKTVISIDMLFNLYAVCLGVSFLQFPWIRRSTGNAIITVLYIIFGTAPILLALILSVNFFVPKEQTKTETHYIESLDYSGGTVLLSYKDSAYKDDPGARRFELEELRKMPSQLGVEYKVRKGILGFDVIEDRIVR